ncbi:MAG: hypothetical protein HYV09_24105 [Deltaproteobacteria bacterium]|nr:hypothetical protein [Deltaproteobacteria bacterium]
MTTVAPSTATKTSTALGHIETLKYAVFNKIDLPADINLAGLMDWLGNRMNDSDTNIRSMMTDINKGKVQKEALNELIAALRETKKNTDVGGGYVKVEPPFDDPKAIKGSDFFESLNATDKAKLSAILDRIYPAEVKVMVMTVAGKVDSGKRIPADDPAAAGIKPGDPEYLPPRIKQEHLDDDIRTLGDMVSTIGSHDEIEMIKMQSAISARGQLLQMVSNMMASFNQTNDKVIGNMR